MTSTSNNASTSYKFTIPTLTGVDGKNVVSNFLSLNDLGVVAAFEMNAGTGISTAFEFNPLTVAFRNQPVALSLALTPAATSIMAVGINNAGIADGIYMDANGFTHGWVSTSTTAVDAPTSVFPNSVFNQLLSIDDFGDLAGYSSDMKNGLTDQLAYVREGGVYTNINSVLPKNVNSQATGIADSGEIVGFYQPTATTSVGFYIPKLGATPVSLQFPGAAFTQALSVSASGVIVGVFQDPNGTMVNGAVQNHGFIFNPTTGVYSQIDVPESGATTSTTVNGINDQGEISGFFTDSNGNTFGFAATPVSVIPYISEVQTIAEGVLRTPLDPTAASSLASGLASGSSTFASIESQFLTQGVPTNGMSFLSPGNSTTTPALITYDWLLGKTPSSGGLDFLAGQAQSFVQQGFSQQNVFLNLAITDALQVSGSTFTSTYGSMTDAQFVATVFKDIYGSSNASAQATFLTALQTTYTQFVSKNGYTGAQTDLAAKAATAGVMLSDFGTNSYAAPVAAFYAAAASGSNFINTPTGQLDIYGTNLRLL